MNIHSPQKNENILSYLLILTGFLMLLELSFFIQCNRVYLSDFTFVSKNLSIPVTIIPGLVYFIFSQMIIHLLYCFSLWIIIELVSEYLQPLAKNKLEVVISVWLLSVLTILAANQYYFPNSKFAELTSLILFNQAIAKIAYLFLASCCGVVILLACYSLWLRFLEKRWVLISVTFILAAILTSTYIFKSQTITQPFVASASRPNIILIGLDSLRPDFLSYFGYDRPTPFLDSLLEESSVFSEAVTPLARTFPSWSSLLTGQYPRESRIRSNLADQQTLQLANTLPAILQRNGYETVYATDETRFSNIDKNFGFDHIIGPPMGLNDFLIGNFNDFPLSNLFINTFIGKILFPYSYANRGVHFTYSPNSFLQLLKPVLLKKRQQPLFLAAHFCLTHSPYLWTRLDGNNLNAQARYVASIQRLDKQIQQFFVLLKQQGLLDHAIIVLLSDHGEALEFPGDRITEKDLYISSSPKKNTKIPVFYPQGLEHENVNQSAGHGTDVMGLPQYHTLLAFKLYGVEKFHTGNITGVVSLIDIKPTLLELLKIASPHSSGISLLPWILEQQPTACLKTRHIFMESDFSPAAIRTVYPEVRKVMMEGIDIFQINPVTTRLTVKHSMAAKIIASKQYADIYAEWMLALYPQGKNKRMPILINLNTGQWTNDLQTAFAKASPAQLMLAELRAFYGDEIAIVIGKNSDPPPIGEGG